MTVLFLTADLGGNVPPTLAVAAAVSCRGVEVEIAGLPAGRTALPQLPFPPATATRADGRAPGWGELAALARLTAGRLGSHAAGALIAERRPDAVVVDGMIPAVLRGALDSGVPVVVLFHTFGAYWARSFDRGPMGAVLGARGFRPGRLWSRAAARLLLTERDLDPGRDDPALSGFVWTGTTELGAEPATRGDRARGDRPRVLVALSSSPWPGMLPVYRRIVAALAELPVDAVVTTGGVGLGGHLAGAPNVEVRGYVPHEELLPSVDLVIGHGGHSTTLKALAHGIPLLVLPINPTADQRLIGQAVQTAGLGRRLPRAASPTAIRDAAWAILADGRVRACAGETGRRLRAAPPGAELAADRIIAVLA